MTTERLICLYLTSSKWLWPLCLLPHVPERARERRILPIGPVRLEHAERLHEVRLPVPDVVATLETPDRPLHVVAGGVGDDALQVGGLGGRRVDLREAPLGKLSERLE
jgi:hypothetical protein